MSKLIRGFALLSISSFIAIIVAYLIHVALGRMLGPEGYGAFSVVNSLVTVIAALTTAGIPIAVAKYVSEREEKNDSTGSKNILKKGLSIQLIIALPIFLIYIMASNQIAVFLGDPTFTTFIQISAFSILAWPISSVFNHYLTGKKAFGKNTITAISINTSRLLSIILVMMGFGVAGAIGGYVISYTIGIVVVLGLYWTITKDEKTTNIENEESITTKKILKFALPAISSAVLLTILHSLDILAIKILLKSDELTGYYGAAATISRLSFFFITAISVVMLPTLSGVISAGKIQLTGLYIRRTIRYLLLALLPIALIVALTAKKLVMLIFSEQYVFASNPLPILFLGYVGIVFIQIFATVANAEGRPMRIAKIIALSVLISGILNLLLDPWIGIVGAAIATTIAVMVGVIFAWNQIQKTYGINIKTRTIMNISLGLLVILGVWVILNNIFTQINGIFVLFEYSILSIGYMLFLVISGEITREDVEIGLNILPKKIMKYVQEPLNKYIKH